MHGNKSNAYLIHKEIVSTQFFCKLTVHCFVYMNDMYCLLVGVMQQVLDSLLFIFLLSRFELRTLSGLFNEQGEFPPSLINMQISRLDHGYITLWECNKCTAINYGICTLKSNLFCLMSTAKWESLTLQTQIHCFKESLFKTVDSQHNT